MAARICGASFRVRRFPTGSSLSRLPPIESTSCRSSLLKNHKYALRRSFATSRVPDSTIDEVSPSNENLNLISGVRCIPHPAKNSPTGEDAFMISSCGKVLAIADGVGGWAEHGIDPGLYSLTLLQRVNAHVKEALLVPNNNYLPEDMTPVQLLRGAFNDVTKQAILGSCTVCMAVLKREDTSSDPQQWYYYLDVANLGDSGILILRPDSEDLKCAEWKVIYKSKEQQHFFNCPYQLGTESTDMPEHSEVSTVPVQKGDMIIMATDSLFDNLFLEEINATLLELLKTVPFTSMFGFQSIPTSLRRRLSHSSPPKDKLLDWHLLPGIFADKLAITTFRASQDRKKVTPFQVHAQKAGFQYLGGKMDDTTVLVSIVGTPEKKQEDEDYLH